jgi:hypothetical protein
MKFKNWLETDLSPGVWQTLNGQGYQVQISQYSNKGPLFSILSSEGDIIGRAYFDIFTSKWEIKEAN